MGIVSPAEGEVVSGLVNVKALASTSSGLVTKVEFFVDGQLRKTDYGPSYDLSWAAGTANGSHVLEARATTSTGTVVTSAPVPVTRV